MQQRRGRLCRRLQNEENTPSSPCTTRAPGDHREEDTMSSPTSPSSPLSSARSRPQFRNIHVSQIVKYSLPPAGMVSILHRVSGAALFLFLPLLLWLFDQSLISEMSFQKLTAFAGQWWVRIILLGLIWAFLHHLVAGIRYLVLDLHMGLDKGPSRSSALAVFVISLPLALLAGLRLFGVF
jgi:succinate dehydrogenase / fumarate reductase, cytochrome b subunit